MSDPILTQIDERLKDLRLECWREIRDHADAKPAFALLRVYSKLKMFCEFYDNLRGGLHEHDTRDVGASPPRNGREQQGTFAQASEEG